jgi:hypothetical protein
LMGLDLERRGVQDHGADHGQLVARSARRTRPEPSRLPAPDRGLLQVAGLGLREVGGANLAPLVNSRSPRGRLCRRWAGRRYADAVPA